MSRFLKLRDLLQGDQPVSGRVIAVSNGVVRVATPYGVVEVAGDSGLRTGDAVTVQDGLAVKKRLDGEGPVYFV